MVSLLMECSLFISQPNGAHHSHTNLNPNFVIAATFLMFPGQISDRIAECLSVCLAEWIVSGHSTLCPAIKTVMMMLVRGCSIISYDDLVLSYTTTTSDKLLPEIKVSPTSKRFFINNFIEC